MFAKLALPLIAISTFATGVFSSPVSIPQGGVDDFNGFNRHQTVVDSGEVCHSVDITIIQQRLAVLQEMAKRIITEQICEVETQTIVFEQYFQSLGHFKGDLRRHSGIHPSYDRGIVGHFGNIYNSDGSFCTDDWNFSGNDIGSQTVVVSDNWNDQTSPQSVDSAYYAAIQSYYVALLASFFPSFICPSRLYFNILRYSPTMFAASAALFVLSLLSLTSAKPLALRREEALMLRNAPIMSLQARDNVTFNNFNNISQLQNFDNFNGQGNFDGSNNGQTVVIKEVQETCQVVQIEIVQQKLAILQEIAKRIITEQICDVQVQTIVLEQHRGALTVFSDDIQRKQVTRQIGYDATVAQKITELVNTDGTLSTSDNGFTGSDVGKNLVVPAGNNWDNSTGPARVQSALTAAQSALNNTSSQ
ncbi:hypothetical protein MSAN_00376300 [Mycena sanguinolenta]|uniref:Uncharacterized protein n=1 Tax=Mycena sanguinolenta TaxID=230812 RepID=A0A8H6ZCJ2_9AGAR|nr:hypothetical protein MSAN_00376300 [Mycena sanguinolenta]